MSRKIRKQLAEETLEIIESGSYTTPSGKVMNVGASIRHMVAATELYKPEILSEMITQTIAGQVYDTMIEVNNETVLSAASRLAVAQGLDRVLCLNFASAKNPGGGFLGGSQAQEESLARSSALYESLISQPDYYEINRAGKNALYTDHMIYSPDVPVFREDSGELLESPYAVSILTSPAPNRGAILKNSPHQLDRVRSTMQRRIDMVLAIAASQGMKHLVLGAWGCGVFRNDPTEVAELFAQFLNKDGKYGRSFETVVFAVLDNDEGKIVTPFLEQFASELEVGE